MPAFNGTAPDERPITLQMMSVQGPLARTVGDLRLGLAAMAQPDPRDPWYAPAPLELPLPPRPWRIAFSTLGAEEPVAAALRQAAGWLAEAGCAVEEISLPRVEEAAELWRGLLMTEGERAMSPVIEKYGDAQIKAAYAGWAANVPTLGPAAFAAGLARRTAIWRDWSVFLSAYAAAQDAVDALYRDDDAWTRRAATNTLNMGVFSSDRSVREYAQRIWRIRPVL